MGISIHTYWPNRKKKKKRWHSNSLKMHYVCYKGKCLQFSHYSIRYSFSQCHDVFPPISTPCFYWPMQAGKTLSVRKWQAAFSPEGHLDLGKTLSRIYRGVSESLWFHGCNLVCLDLFSILAQFSFAFLCSYW